MAAGKFGDAADGAIARATPPQQGNAQSLQSSGQQGSSAGVSRSECVKCEVASGSPGEGCPARDPLGAHSQAPQDSGLSQRSTDKRAGKGTWIVMVPRTRTIARPIVLRLPHDEFIRPPIMFPPPSLLPRLQALLLDSCATPLAPKSRTRASPPGGNEGIPRT